MINSLKQFEDLKEGNCKVVTRYINGEKIFDGYYREKFNVVYFTIPSTYEVIGYIQY